MPLIVVIPFQTGVSLGLFQSWTSTLFVSTSNFIIPVIIYFKCVQFRKKYNADHILTGKQLNILKRIHSKSNTLVKFLGQKALRLNYQLQAKKEPVDINTAENSSDIINHPVLVQQESTDLERDNDSIPVPLSIEMVAPELGSIIQENVPDPDKEDEEEGRLLTPQPSFVTRLVTTLNRTMKNVPKENITEDIEIHVIPSLKRNDSLSSDSLSQNSHSLPRPHDFSEVYTITHTVQGGSESTLKPDTASAVTISDVIEVVGPKPPSEHSLMGIPSRDVARNSWEWNSMNRSGDRLGRLKTLPTHPNFKSPAFRSVPKWMPIRGYHMAWIVLIVTSIVAIANLAMLLK